MISCEWYDEMFGGNGVKVQIYQFKFGQKYEKEQLVVNKLVFDRI